MGSMNATELTTHIVTSGMSTIGLLGGSPSKGYPGWDQGKSVSMAVDSSFLKSPKIPDYITLRSQSDSLGLSAVRIVGYLGDGICLGEWMTTTTSNGLTGPLAETVEPW